MSRSLAANSGSLESLNRLTRCGCKPCPAQIRCTERRLIPATSAIARPVQWVASPGGSASVNAITRSTTASGSGGLSFVDRWLHW